MPLTKNNTKKSNGNICPKVKSSSLESQSCWIPRVYTEQFGRSLIEALQAHRPHGTLRQKKHICTRKTDVQIFLEMDLGDCWNDAELVPVYAYPRTGTRGNIPDTWQNAISQFDDELLSRGYQI